MVNHQFFDAASADQLKKLDITLNHFGVSTQRQLLSEALLRLGKYVGESETCMLPKDEPSRALFKMYRYYFELPAGIS